MLTIGVAGTADVEAHGPMVASNAKSTGGTINVLGGTVYGSILNDSANHGAFVNVGTAKSGDVPASRPEVHGEVDEGARLEGLGWLGEGIGWYAMPLVPEHHNVELPHGRCCTSTRF